MRIRRYWWLLFIPPVLVFAFYLVLIGANYYYAQRATYLLDRIRTMPIDDSAIAELKRLGSEHGFRYEGATNCDESPCIHMVAPNNLWMQHLLTSRLTRDVGLLFGLRPWLAVGDIELDHRQVVGKIYGLAFFGGRFDPSMQATGWETRDFELNACSYYPIKRHPGYGFRNATNTQSFRALVSIDAAAENRDRAFEFDLKCLKPGHKCDQFSDLMPAAWADYEEDGRWQEAHPSNLVWEVGEKCPF